jgi:hypothetical protein
MPNATQLPLFTLTLHLTEFFFTKIKHMFTFVQRRFKQSVCIWLKSCFCYNISFYLMRRRVISRAPISVATQFCGFILIENLIFYIVEGWLQLLGFKLFQGLSYELNSGKYLLFLFVFDCQIPYLI